MIKIISVLLLVLLLFSCVGSGDMYKVNTVESNNITIVKSEPLTFTISVYDFFKYIFYYLRKFCGT